MGREWKESEGRLVRFPYHDPEAFELYLRWVYSHRIILQSADQSNEDKAAACSLLARTYVLGDVVQDTDAKDALLDALVDYQDQTDWTPYEEARYLYENTGPRSPIRRWLVDAVVGKYSLNRVDPPIYAQEVRKFQCVEFLSDVLELLDGHHRDPHSFTNTVDTSDACAYHEHGTDPCYKIKYRVGV